jgi:osmotically-inducible protein OsmY
MLLTEEEIQRNVLEEFKWDARIRPSEIGVTVKDGVVTLPGTVDSYPSARSTNRTRCPTTSRSPSTRAG